MELRDFLTVIGIVASGMGSYAAAMTKMRLKLQHVEDVKIDREDVERKLSEERARLDASHSAIYTRINTDHGEVMGGLGKLQNLVTEVKTTVDLLPCPGRFSVPQRGAPTCG